MDINYLKIVIFKINNYIFFIILKCQKVGLVDVLKKLLSNNYINSITINKVKNLRDNDPQKKLIEEVVNDCHNAI